MRTKKFIALFLIAIIMMANMGSGVIAKAEETAGTYVEITDNDAKLWDLTPGKTTTVVVPVKAIKTYIYNPTITVKAADANAPFTISKPKMYTSAIPFGVFAIDLNATTYIEFDVTTKESATIGKYKLDITISNFEAPSIDSDNNNITQKTSTSLSILTRIQQEKVPAQLAVSNIKYSEDSAAIGNTFDVSFDVTNDGEISALNTYLVMDYGTSGIVAGYANEKMKIGDLTAGATKNVKLSMKVLSNATEGLKELKAGFNYKDSDGEKYTSSKSAYISVKKTSTQASDDAKLVLNNTVKNHEVAAGAEFNLVGEIKNVGKIKATNVEVGITNGTGVTSGIISKGDTATIPVANIAPGKTAKFKLPMLATETAPGGLIELSVQVSYTDSKGNTKTSVTPFYVTVIKKDAVKEDSDVIITNISQSPDQPMVGQKVTVSFDVENRGSKAVTALTVGGESLSSAGFEPFTPQAIKDLGSLAAGAKKRVSLDFRAGANIPEGMNTLVIGCHFKDATGTKQATTTNAYILDVINDNNSKPKLIVSDYKKDSEELKAGSVFNFTYTIKNTHTTKTAKNIKVTISEKDNVFSASQGTNTFYIDRIKAGESVEKTIELKVKPDVTTAAYELEIKMEYEYDGMAKVDLENGGVTESSKLKLQAVENLRPSVQNLAVGNYGEAPTVNTSSLLTFDFINMGKSPLNNVRFSLEGDFTLETGKSYYHGTVAPGAPETVELSVMPTVAGMCGGTLIITFENSNGEEVEKREEFSDISVMEQMTMDDLNNGGADPGMPAFDPTQTDAKKDIMPVWVFVAIQVAILAIFIPVVRMILIKAHKKKVRQEDSLL